MAYDERTAERVRRVLGNRRQVVEKKLMGGLCFMVSGAMCCSVSGKGGLLIRIGAEAQSRMLAEPNVEPMRMGHRVMRGFVRVGPAGYRTDRELKTWLKLGLNAVAALPKKKATRAKGRS